jgi:uncharacterized membrane protein
MDNIKKKTTQINNGKAVLTSIIAITCLATLIFIVQTTDTSSKALIIPMIAHYNVANIKPLQQKESNYDSC